MSNKAAELQAKKYLEVIDVLYPEITEEFGNIETGGYVAKNDVHVIRFGDKVKKALRILKQINPKELLALIDEKALETVQHNINFVYDDLLYIQKRLLAFDFIDDLQVPVANYLKQIAGNPSNYKRWADDEDQLTSKFIAMLTHPDNIEAYKNQIKRIALGTMSQREFNKIYNATRHKMIPLPEENNKFKSFKDYETQD